MAEELGEEKEECRRMMAEADKDDDGTLNWEEFMRVIKKTSYL
jgi:Ca2+-binding EF-hand superfamily protein